MLKLITRRVWPTLWRTICEWSDDDGSRMATSLAYYGVLSFFPMLLVIIAIFGWVTQLWPDLKLQQEGLIDEINKTTQNGDLAKLVERVLNEVKSQAILGGPVGVIGVLLASIGIFSQLEDSLYRIWKVKNAPKSGGIWWMVWHVLLHRLKAFAMLLALGVLLMATFFGGFMLAAVEKFAGEWWLATDVLDWLHKKIGLDVWRWLHLGVGITLNAVFFTLIYKLLSKGPVRWSVAIIGGFCTSFAWEFGRWLLAWFLVGKKYNAYEVVGALLAIMIWFYYASTILLFGAELIQVISRMKIEKENENVV